MDPLSAKLIEAVREIPFLYDRSLEDYKNNHKKSMAWSQISDQLGGESGAAMREKWKNLRDTYKKHTKSLQSGEVGKAATKYKKWVWGAHMQFLDRFITKKTTEDTPLKLYTEADESTQRNTSIQASAGSSTNPFVYNNEPQCSSENNTRNQKKSGTRRRKMKNDNTIDKVLDYLRSKRSNKIERARLDKTDYLFLYYADTFKRLTPRRQATLKLDLAKLFTEAELADLDKANTSPGRVSGNDTSVLTPMHSVTNH